MAANRRMSCWLGVGLLSSFVVLGLLGSLFLRRVRQEGAAELEKWKNDMRARGERFTLAELNVPKAPKEGNGASALLEAADELEALKAKCSLLTQGLPVMKCVGPGKIIGLAGLTKFELAFRSEDRSKVGACDWRELEQELIIAEPSLSKARQSVQQPFLAVDLDYAQGLELKIPHLDQARLIARRLHASAIGNLHRGNLDAALNDIEAIVLLRRFPKDDRTIISQLVRLAIGSIGMGATWQGLQMPGWNDEQLKQLQNGWRDDRGMEDVARAYEMERVFFLQVIERLRRNPDAWMQMNEFFGKPESRVERNFAMSLGFWIWRWCYSYEDELAGLQWYQHALDALRDVSKNRAWQGMKPVLDELNRSVETCKNDPSIYTKVKHLVSALTTPAMGRAVTSCARYEVFRNLTETAVALKRYQLKHGAFPPTLDAVAPELLPQEPRDFMDGKPLRYRLNPDGSFLLYSVGENLMDDGGDPRPMPGEKEPTYWNGLDTVWPSPATKAEIDAFAKGR